MKQFGCWSNMIIKQTLSLRYHSQEYFYPIKYCSKHSCLYPSNSQNTRLMKNFPNKCNFLISIFFSFSLFFPLFLPFFFPLYVRVSLCAQVISWDNRLSLPYLINKETRRIINVLGKWPSWIKLNWPPGQPTIDTVTNL